MGVLIFFLIVLTIIIVICAFIVQETNGGSLLVICICGLICWGLVEGLTTDTSDPTPVDICQLSIMTDDEVAIIRYKGKNYFLSPALDECKP